MFEIRNLSVSVEGKMILKNFNLHISEGEVHVLLGPNGAGKTTLIKTILGFKNYKVEEGSILFKGKDITDLPTYERIKMGLGVLFQNPPSIHGVKLGQLLKICGQKRGLFLTEKIIKEKGDNNKEYSISEDVCIDDPDDYISKLAAELNFNGDYLQRDINVGFSGGEIKRSEILQMMIMQPDFLLFDEPDSGVDVENVELIANVMRRLLDRDKIPAHQKKAGLIITHLGYILRFLGHITRAHVMIDGKIQCSGDPSIIIQTIMKDGFNACANCLHSQIQVIEKDGREVCIDDR